MRRPEYPNHVWAYGFLLDRTQDGHPLKLLTVVDEYTRACLAIAVRRRMTATDVQEVLGELFLTRGCPTHIRSDNGRASAYILWAGVHRPVVATVGGRVEIAPLFIEPGSPWEHGYGESFNGKFRYDLLKEELFYTLLEAQVLIERWRRHDNTKRPQSSLGDRLPAPDTITPQPVCA